MTTDALPAAAADPADAHHRRGLALFAAGNHAGAVAAYTAALALRPGHADALNNRGAARAAAGDRAGAFADYDAALAADPALAAAFNNRAVARFQAGDVHAALDDLRAAVRLDPGYAAAYENCAAVHDRLFEHAQAVAHYDRAIELYAADPRLRGRLCHAHVRRGLARYHLGQWAAGLADLKAAHRHSPRLCTRTLAAAVEANARERTAAALEACAAHLARDPGDFLTLFRRALTHLALGDRAGYEADYDAFLRSDWASDDFAFAMALLTAVEDRLAVVPL